MRAALGQIYERLVTFGYPKVGIDRVKQHRLPIIIVLAAAGWILLLAMIVGAMWFYQAVSGSL